ncbi:MAG TPA: glucose-6-phosphate dehydrogenase assembly protein OpcA [Solirubrobacteraceae bacterium]|nr:glucose-6-phosphate dehydrogenase assembly protein OpcA [Solirubrobacteraceae bacterium]
MARNDAVWSAQGTTPDAIEAALRELLAQRHAENAAYAPARVLNMLVFVEDAWSGEVANRLRGVGRYHASRVIVLAYDPRRERLDARASIAADEPASGELALLRETVVVRIGPHHLDDLHTIADPLVVTDLPTLLWSPHGHEDAAEALLSLAQAALVDSIDEPVWHAAIRRACELSRRVYVVDLAWLRTTPWRERIAAVFDSGRMRAELPQIEAMRVRHHPSSTVAAMLLAGWLSSRLGWEPSAMRAAAHNGGARTLAGAARADAGEVALELTSAPELEVPGLAGVEVTCRSGLRVRLDRGAGGLRAHQREPDGDERSWTLLGASRGESGILGEGIRQALLRDPTYTPALGAAQSMLPDLATA